MHTRIFYISVRSSHKYDDIQKGVFNLATVLLLNPSTPIPYTDPKSSISCDPPGCKVLEDKHFLFIFVILTL